MTRNTFNRDEIDHTFNLALDKTYKMIWNEEEVVID